MRRRRRSSMARRRPSEALSSLHLLRPPTPPSPLILPKNASLMAPMALTIRHYLFYIPLTRYELLLCSPLICARSRNLRRPFRAAFCFSLPPFLHFLTSPLLLLFFCPLPVLFLFGLRCALISGIKCHLDVSASIPVFNPPFQSPILRDELVPPLF